MGTCKLLALDLDGTLLNSGHRVLESSRAAIAEACEQGVKVVLATGRHHTATYAYHHELGLDTPAICCNGTYIMDFQSQQPVYSNPLQKDKARKIIGITREMGLHALMYNQDAMMLEAWNPHTEALKHWSDQLPEPLRPALQPVDDFLHEVDVAQSVYKFVLSHSDGERLQEAVSQIEHRLEVSCEGSWINRVDVANVGNSKGNALKHLAEEWGISAKEVIALGDNDNDISMVEFAGLGVAMGKCTEGVKRVSDMQIGGNDDDSIARLIRQHVLI